jgi:hypothetical protein
LFVASLAASGPGGVCIWRAASHGRFANRQQPERPGAAMHGLRLLISALVAGAAAALATRQQISSSTAGVEALVQRRLPRHAGSFEFAIVNASASDSPPTNDSYVVSTNREGKIQVDGNSPSALLSGLELSTHVLSS